MAATVRRSHTYLPVKHLWESFAAIMSCEFLTGALRSQAISMRENGAAFISQVKVLEQL